MDRDPTRTAAREARRRKRLGPNTVCVRCGEVRPEALEVHHPAGHAHDPGRKSNRCRNCHSVVSEAQARGDVELAPQRNVLDRAIARHRALAVDTRDAAEAEDRAAAKLEEFRTFLNDELPDWPKLWEKRK